MSTKEYCDRLYRVNNALDACYNEAKVLLRCLDRKLPIGIDLNQEMFGVKIKIHVTEQN